MLLLVTLLPRVLPFLKVNWKLLLGALVAAAFGLFVWSWHSRGETISALERDLKAERQRVALAEEGQKAISRRHTEASTRGVAVARITEEARHAPVTSDAPLAPVLRDALAGVRGLRQRSKASGGDAP